MSLITVFMIIVFNDDHCPMHAVVPNAVAAAVAAAIIILSTTPQIVFFFIVLCFLKV